VEPRESGVLRRGQAEKGLKRPPLISPSSNATPLLQESHGTLINQSKLATSSRRAMAVHMACTLRGRPSRPLFSSSFDSVRRWAPLGKGSAVAKSVKSACDPHVATMASRLAARSALAPKLTCLYFFNRCSVSLEPPDSTATSIRVCA